MIKKFNTGMIDQVMSLWISYQQEKYVEPHQVVAQYERVMKRYLEDEVILVDMEKDVCIGYIVLTQRLGIDFIYVHPDYRRKQHGTQLVEQAIQSFKQLHVILSHQQKDLIEFFSVNSFAITQTQEKNHHSQLVMVNIKDIKH